MVDVKEIIKNFKTKEEIEEFIKQLREAANEVPSVKYIKIPHRGKKIYMKIVAHRKYSYSELKSIIKALGRSMYSIEECVCTFGPEEDEIKLYVKGLRKVVLDSVIYNSKMNSIQEVDVKDTDFGAPMAKPIIATEPYEFEGDYRNLSERKVQMLVESYELAPLNC